MTKFEKVEALTNERNAINTEVVRLEDQIMRYPMDPTAKYSVLRRLKELYIKDYEIQQEIKELVGEGRRPSFWNLVNRL